MIGTAEGSLDDDRCAPVAQPDDTPSPSGTPPPPSTCLSNSYTAAEGWNRTLRDEVVGRPRETQTLLSIRCKKLRRRRMAPELQGAAHRRREGSRKQTCDSCELTRWRRISPGQVCGTIDYAYSNTR